MSEPLRGIKEGTHGQQLREGPSQWTGGEWGVDWGLGEGEGPPAAGHLLGELGGEGEHVCFSRAPGGQGCFQSSSLPFGAVHPFIPRYSYYSFYRMSGSGHWGFKAEASVTPSCPEEFPFQEET